MGCGGSKLDTKKAVVSTSPNPAANVSNNGSSSASAALDTNNKLQEELKQTREEKARRGAEQERLRKENEEAEIAFKASKMLPEPPMFCGHMSRQGQVFRKWQKRFFVLKKGELVYYENETSPGSQLGDNMIGKPLNLRGYVVTEMEDDELFLNMPGRKHTISDNFSTRDKNLAMSPTSSNGGNDKTVARSLLVKIETPADKVKWEKALNEHIEYMNSLL